MMVLAALLQAAAATVAPPPADWSILAELPLSRRTVNAPELSRFVRDEVVAGRCSAARAVTTGWRLDIDLAIQVGDDNLVRRIVPRAINCPTVEQYASGLVLATVRGKVAAANGWYRTTLSFAWSG